MRIRTILSILALMAILSIAFGGMYYYYSLKQSAYSLANRRAAQRTEIIKSTVSAYLSENLKPVRALARIPEIRLALVREAPGVLAAANRILDHFQDGLDVEVCYLMDQTGRTIASSNRNDPDSFVGQNFSFRPYFQEAIVGRPGKYMALGTTSLRRGAYYSFPVFSPTDELRGVVVIKASIRRMDETIIRSPEGLTFLVSPKGIIFSASNREWLYKTLWRPKPGDDEALKAGRQFGEGPWAWSGFRRTGENRAVDRSGREYVVYSLPVDRYHGWRVVHMVDIRAAAEGVIEPMVRSTTWLVLALCLIAGLTVLYLFSTARRQIDRRRRVENELRVSEERYRTLYHNTPAMLLSLAADGTVLHVSGYWSEGFGYSPEETEGRPITDFLRPDSRDRLREEALPALLAGGECRDVPLRMIQKDGRVIHALMTGVAEASEGGEVHRILAVLVDVTERVKAEEELRRAQEKLSNYSKDLEQQVRARTREVTAFLEYTPALIYMKDAEGRYLLVNSQWEERFGARVEEVRGKTVYEVFPRELADQFRLSDRYVLSMKRPFQIEEAILIGGEERMVLSVRFPILDEAGEVNRICGISVDVTELKAAQEKLRRLSGSIIANQEKERMAIARELHDELGQVLTALRMDAVWIRERIAGADEKGRERAGTMVELIDSTITEVRSIARRLRPAVLDDLGLLDALSWYTTDFEARTGIVCVFKGGGEPLEAGEVLSIAAYRVAQEALTNVARHSNAGYVEVTLSSDDLELVLSVRDDGVGFDPEIVSEDMQFGLAGMRERAYLVGGRLEVRSRPGEGTEVFFQAPLSRFGGEQ